MKEELTRYDKGDIGACIQEINYELSNEKSDIDKIKQCANDILRTIKFREEVED